MHTFTAITAFEVNIIRDLVPQDTGHKIDRI